MPFTICFWNFKKYTHSVNTLFMFALLKHCMTHVNIAAEKHESIDDE